MSSISSDFDIFGQVYDALEAQNVNTDIIDIALTSGWVGDMFPKDMFPDKYKKYTEIVQTDIGYDDNCVWSPDMLSCKLISTFDPFVYEKDNTISCMMNMQLVRFTNIITNKSTEEALWNIDTKELVFIKDIKFIKLPAFDGYIKSAIKIQRAWRKWTAKRNAAAIIIQHAVLEYIYHPNRKMAKDLQLNFYMLAIH
jgi:hypothetical protein